MNASKLIFLICILSGLSYGLFLVDTKVFGKAQPLDHLNSRD